MKLITLILLLGGVTLATAQQPENINGVKIDDVVESLRTAPEPKKEALGSNELPAILRNGDRALQADQSEQNFRSLFSRSTGPDDFFTADEASETATKGVGQSSVLAKVTNQQPRNAFSPVARGPGGSDDDEMTGLDVVNKRLGEIQGCVYDIANSRSCNYSPFREPTARCTNTMTGKKTWGMAGTPFSRILPPRYEDGVGARRTTGLSSGVALKSPREITVTVTSTIPVLDFFFSSHVMQWGQFIAHEFTQLAETDSNANCCPKDIALEEFGRPGTVAELEEIRDLLIQFRPNVCQQIELANDPVHGEDICINHVRSKATPQHNCVLGPRQQMNAITHVFDASNVYGSSQAEQNELRDGSGGKMKTQIKNGAILPPPDTGPSCPLFKRVAGKCPFLAGDKRINTTPNLISAHTAFVNKHNQVAEGLALMNPPWDDERLFQETRRIISAIQSNIHFYEYLPVIISDSVLNKFKLKAYDGLHTDVNPSVVTELATAAMRYGHSLINGIYSLEKDGGGSVSANLRLTFFDSDLIYNGGTKQCAKGLSKDGIWTADRHFPSQMRDFLFDQPSDIVALNINRGRDHGLASYVDYRAFYGLSVPNSFADLASTHPADVISRLSTAYVNIGDVELYIGGISENPMPGGVVGELFSNILADGFSRMRDGDRFFFEGKGSGLTTSQIAEIKKYKYSQLLCEGNGLVKTLSKAFFREGNAGSTEVDCSSDFSPLDLSLWKANQSSSICPWKIIKKTKCCRGKQTVFRKCDKSANCNCPNGKKKIRKKCICKSKKCRRCRNRRRRRKDGK